MVKPVILRMKRLIPVFLIVILILVTSNLFAIIEEDSYEDDDAYTSSNNIATNGSRQYHNFHYPGDIDYVNFTAEAGATYVIQTHLITPASYTDTVMTLYGIDGTTQITQNDDIVLGNIRNSRIFWKENR